jgi:hypothetical protein
MTIDEQDAMIEDFLASRDAAMAAVAALSQLEIETVVEWEDSDEDSV